MAENNTMTISAAFELVEFKCICSEPNCKTSGKCKFDHIKGVTGKCETFIALEVIKKELKETAPRGQWEPVNADQRGYTNHFICNHCKRDVYLTKYCRTNDEFENCPHCRAIMDL